MNQGKNFVEGLQKMADAMVASASQIKETIIEFVRNHIDSLMKSRYLVSREEFEALKAVVEKMQNHTHCNIDAECHNNQECKEHSKECSGEEAGEGEKVIQTPRKSKKKKEEK